MILILEIAFLRTEQYTKITQDKKISIHDESGIIFIGCKNSIDSIYDFMLTRQSYSKKDS